MVITSIFGREILDSRGNPTVECQISLSDGKTVIASTPAGASLGSGEAKELRDGDKNRYNGFGVLQAISNIDEQIAPLLIGKKPDLETADMAMIALDGTPNKSRLGANALIAVSMAIARAHAHVEGLTLYRFINALAKIKMGFPRLMVNMINGGAHANNKLSIQEILVIPPRQKSIVQEVEMTATFQGYLKKRLEQDKMSTNVGDEGGFAPEFFNTGQTEEECALNYLTNALDFHSEHGFTFGLDVAASHFFNHKTSLYNLSGKLITAHELLAFYKRLIQQFPLVSIEDSFDEHAHTSWQEITKILGAQLTLVGDDIFVSHPKIIQKGIDDGIANATIIKPNQIGTVSEALDAVFVARRGGYKIVASHRSGETNDTFIADFAVGICADYLKAGGCMRGERVAKYNRLMEIEQDINK